MASIIKSIYWESTSQEELVYKFPFNNITTGSVLTVNESQEAFFYKSGTLCDSFTSGRHQLKTANLPIIQKFLNIPSEGETTFTAEIWFVSKLEKRNILWGTGGLRVVDPYFQIPIKIAARGQYGLRIIDGGTFLKKLIGTIGYADMELIDNQFRIDVIEAVKISISKYMKENNINVNELGMEYRGISRETSKSLQISFNEYGIEILNFNIEDISFDENDKGYQTVLSGIAEQARLSKLGVNYLQQKQLDIAQTAAGNEGAGVVMGAGMGFGMGNTMGNVMGTVMANSGLASAPPTPPIMSSFYVAQNGQTTGPYSMDILKEMIANRKIISSTYVCKAGSQTWVLASNEPEITTLLLMMAPPPPPPVL